MRRPVLAALGILVVASCADLFGEPSQCADDGDCERFGGVCDVAQAVCVAKPPPEAVSTDPPPPPKDAAVDREPLEERCNVHPKPTAVIGVKAEGGAHSEMTTGTTLGCDKDWVLDGPVFVRSGATLTIEAGTTVRARKGTNAALVIAPGGRIAAEGTREKPVVLTSESAPPLPDDWRGVFVLGVAPPSGQGPYDDDPALAWGGPNEDDNSGTLTFVRIEYAKSGLVLAGAGRKTVVDYVEVRRPALTCFTFYGGRVDAKHLVCQSPGDEQFSWSLGYTGRAQFLFGQKAALPPTYASHGMLIDDARPAIYNATICGDRPAELNGYGVLFRDNATLNLNSAIVTGWFTGLDASGTLPAPGRVGGTIFFGNATNPAYVEDPSETNPDYATYNDDFGFDEIAFVGAGGPPNSTTDPGLVDCFHPKEPKPWPATSLTANVALPPNDGFFDANARYIGAFEGPSDPWMKGAWVRFDEN